MNILIISDFTKDDDYSFRARHETDILKDHCEVSVRCIHNSLKIGDLNRIDIALHVIRPDKYKYIPGPYNIGWVKLSDKYKYPTILDGVLDEVVSDDVLEVIIDVGKFGQLRPHSIPYLDGECVIFTINNDFESSRTLQLIEDFNKLVDPSEPICFAVKTNKTIDNEITQVKNRLKLYPNISFYKKEVVINSPPDYNEIMNLYSNFNYFIDSTNHMDQRYEDIGHAFNKVVYSIEEACHLIRNKKSIEVGPAVLVDSHINFLKERV